MRRVIIGILFGIIVLFLLFQCAPRRQVVVVSPTPRPTPLWHAEEIREVLGARIDDLLRDHDVCGLNRIYIIGFLLSATDSPIPKRTRRFLKAKVRVCVQGLARELTWRIRGGRYLSESCAPQSSLIFSKGKYDLHIYSEYWTLKDLARLSSENQISFSRDIADQEEVQSRLAHASRKLAGEFRRHWLVVNRGRWCDAADNLLIMMRDDNLSRGDIGLTQRQYRRLEQLGRIHPSPFRTPDSEADRKSDTQI